MSKSKVRLSIFMREYRWTKYLCLVAMLFCLFVGMAQLENGWSLVELVKETAFANALLFGCWFYLSDLRYHLCKEVRND